MLKILAIQFKYIGDAAALVPALRLLRKQYPGAQLHVLVPSEAAPVLEYIPWIDRVWAFPRKRGRWGVSSALPLIGKLHALQFDLSLDFVGNDRGAIISALVGAPMRVGLRDQFPKRWRELIFTHMRDFPALNQREARRIMDFLRALNIEPADDLRPELYSDPSLASWAKKELPDKAILCHLTTSAPKKEWPVDNFAQLYRLADDLQKRLVFLSGPSHRERGILHQLKKELPQAKILEDIPSIAHLMALIKEASAQVSGDTAPAHLAAGLGTPYVMIIGPSPAVQWNPGGRGSLIIASDCPCYGSSKTCLRARHCLKDISAQIVLEKLRALL